MGVSSVGTGDGTSINSNVKVSLVGGCATDPQNNSHNPAFSNPAPDLPYPQVVTIRKFMFTIMHLLTIPLELLLKIVSYLPVKDQRSLVHSHRNLNRLPVSTWDAQADKLEHAVSILFGAVVAQDIPMVEYLLTRGPKIQIWVTDKPHVLLHECPSPCTPAVLAQILQMSHRLVLSGSICRSEVKDAKTALQWAVARNHPVTTRWLLKHGADPAAVPLPVATNPTYMRPPLHIAVRNKSLQCVHALLSASPSLVEQPCGGQSPLQVASSLGMISIVINLLIHGADEAADKLSGMAPVCLAAMSPSLATLEFLSRHGRGSWAERASILDRCVMALSLPGYWGPDSAVGRVPRITREWVSVIRYLLNDKGIPDRRWEMSRRVLITKPLGEVTDDNVERNLYCIRMMFSQARGGYWGEEGGPDWLTRIYD